MLCGSACPDQDDIAPFQIACGIPLIGVAKPIDESPLNRSRRNLTYSCPFRVGAPNHDSTRESGSAHSDGHLIQSATIDGTAAHLAGVALYKDEHASLRDLSLLLMQRFLAPLIRTVRCKPSLQGFPSVRLLVDGHVRPSGPREPCIFQDCARNRLLLRAGDTKRVQKDRYGSILHASIIKDAARMAGAADWQIRSVVPVAQKGSVMAIVEETKVSRPHRLVA